MKKYLLIGIAIVCVLLAFTACAKNEVEATGVSQETRDKVFETVKVKMVDLQTIYHEHSKGAVPPMAGVTDITLFIDKKGIVKSAKVDPVEGNISKEMLKALKKEVMNWTFPTETLMNYQFKASFQPM